MEVGIYDDYLLTKVKLANKKGVRISADTLHPSSKPHQKDVIVWAIELGAGLIGLDAGLGKTHIGIEVMRELHARFGGKYLIVTELGASDTFVDKDPEVGEGARLGIPLEYVTSTKKALESECSIVVTNYERVRNGEFDFSFFNGVWLDEGNYVKNMASETTNILQQQLKKVQYKYIATATPAPNEILELINYAHVLGICDRGQILTRYFQRNSVKAGELTLVDSRKQDFYTWVFSWAIFMTLPSDLNYEDEGYQLPELIINWHEVKLDTAIEGSTDRNTKQKKLYADSTNSLPEAARVKRNSVDARIEFAKNLMLERDGVTDIKDVKTHYLLWHHLENERIALNKTFSKHPNYGQIFGKQDWVTREKNIVAFTKGELQILATKPDLSGVGCNFQKHCHHAIAIGLNHSWDEFYQAIIKRLHRFGQKEKVIIDVLYVREEFDIVTNIKNKWVLHDEQREFMRAIMKQYGLDHSILIEQRRREFAKLKETYTGKDYTLINNDCVYEWRNLPDNHIDFINSSFPFGNHYEYTNMYNDFGHNATNLEFFMQMDYLIPELFRTLKPGRIITVHLKNRIHYGSVTGIGFSVFHRFTHHVCDAMEKHGFLTMGFHYVPTDVVQENNQTYRLGYSEMCKDSTKMGSGIPEEIWVFRKPPTSTDNAYADEPVIHNQATCPHCQHTDKRKEFEATVAFLSCPACKEIIQKDALILVGGQDYTLANWQLDADSFWRSSGNRYLTPEDLNKLDLSKIRKWWNKFNSETVYDYEAHVQLLQDLEEAGKLSRTFTTLPIRSNTDMVWNDVNRMQGLNLEQSRRHQQNHICPQPFDEIDRVIELYSNPGDLIADPFSGIGSTGVRSLNKGRRFFGTELNETYAKTAAFYLRQQEMKKNIPTLFDAIS